jgi:hypothetical protein
MFNLGVLLANQWDPPELDQARIWWEKAADAETTSAMYNLSLRRPTAGTHSAGPGPHLVREGRRWRQHQRDVQPQPAGDQPVGPTPGWTRPAPGTKKAAKKGHRTALQLLASQGLLL